MKQKINYLLKASLGVALAAVVASCGNKTIVTDLAKENLIPKPVSVTATNSSFELTDKTDIYVAGGDEELMKSAKDIGIRVFLQKPFKSDEMMKAIAQVMGASGT